MELEEVKSLRWADVELRNIGWDADGRDVVLRLRAPCSSDARVLVCRWAEALVVSLASPEGRGGYPLTWDATFARLADGKWSVLLDFASAGEVRLVCAEVEIREASEPQQEDRLTDSDLLRIERSCDAATRGPWKAYIEGRDHDSGSSFIQTSAGDIELGGVATADYDFIASARQDMPRLLEEVRALRKIRSQH